MNRDSAQRLEAWLSRALGEPVRVDSAQKPGGGTARETWAVVAVAAGAERPRRNLRVVGGEAPPGRESGRTRCEEFTLLRVAHDAGVHVPRPLVLCADAGVLGAPFFVTDFVEGTENGDRPSRSPGGGAGISEHSPSPGGKLDGAAHRRPNRARANRSADSVGPASAAGRW